MSNLTRRELLAWSAAMGAASFIPVDAFGEPVRGGTLVIAEFPEPTLLTSALIAAAATNNISPKMFDGLVTYDLDTLEAKPQLAESWQMSDDGLTLTFKLRDGVKWHDGKPFSSADVAFTIKEILLKFNSRGKAIYGNVTDVETPDALTVVLKLSKPAPYIMAGLSGWITQILPKHLYEGTDAMKNPANTKPVGTGPFRFVEWERGNYLRLERNPDYWDQPKPYVDEVVYRFLPDASSRVAALESEDVLVVGESKVPGSDLVRLKDVPFLEYETRGYAMLAPTQFFQFNLANKLFQDVRVRRAFAHAIDRDFIVKNIWFGYGTPATGPLPPALKTFYSADVPLYEYDPAKAEALLDEAGYKRGADGIRFSIRHDAAQNGEQFPKTAEFIRDALGKIGIKVDVRISDFASFSKRVYTDRDFDTSNYYTSCGPDPAIGTQRIYWSKAYIKGVSYSNGSGYNNPEVDKVLEAAQIEPNAAKRKALYDQFQRMVQEDLPEIPLISMAQVTITNKKLKNLTSVADGIKANFADAYIEG